MINDKIRRILQFEHKNQYDTKNWRSYESYRMPLMCHKFFTSLKFNLYDHKMAFKRKSSMIPFPKRTTIQVSAAIIARSRDHPACQPSFAQEIKVSIPCDIRCSRPDRFPGVCLTLRISGLWIAAEGPHYSLSLRFVQLNRQIIGSFSTSRWPKCWSVVVSTYVASSFKDALLTGSGFATVTEMPDTLYIVTHPKTNTKSCPFPVALLHKRAQVGNDCYSALGLHWGWGVKTDVKKHGSHTCHFGVRM